MRDDLLARIGKIGNGGAKPSSL